MSHSPTGAQTENPDATYLDAWAELATRIQRGQSFSGRERNCCFLNTRGDRFADASSTFGLDGIDDSRTVAVCDWDHDGDLDLWQANRTGPRVRFYRNDIRPSNSWLAVKLAGAPRNRCPQDAIGARVELHLLDARGNARKQIQTVTAGDGFLSQSSKWLHFGVLEGCTFDKLVVRWPGTNTRETWRELQLDTRYELSQGQSPARAIESRNLQSLRIAATGGDSVETESSSRVWLASPIEVDEHNYESLPSRELLSIDSARHRLICFWASWCSPCVDELNALDAHADEFKRSDLEVLALSVEGLGSESDNGIDAALTFAERSRFRFPMGLASPELLAYLSELRHGVLYRQDDLPLPSSFLIDRRGKLRAFYAGPADPGQLRRDIEQLDSADGQSARDLAAPLPGRWSDDLFITNPIAIANIYRQDKQFGDAEEYLMRYLNTQPDPLSAAAHDSAARRRFADVYRMLGHVANEAGHPQTSLGHLEQALRYDPEDVEALLDIADHQMQRKAWTEASTTLQSALRIARQNPRTLNKLGLVYGALDQTRSAISSFEASLKASPNYFPAANNLAWLLATHPNDAFRDGARAVKLAQRVVRSSRGLPDALDTLAAAHAETGDYESAVSFAEQAIVAASAAELTEVVKKKIESRFELYKQRRAYRETPQAE